jgi:plasmid stability protein
MKATFELDNDLYRAIKVEAARTDRSVRELIEEALAQWLAAAEDAEDLESAAAALEEYRRDGGVAVESWFARAAAETKATYTPDRG